MIPHAKRDENGNGENTEAHHATQTHHSCELAPGSARGSGCEIPGGRAGALLVSGVLLVCDLFFDVYVHKVYDCAYTPRVQVSTAQR